MRWFGLIFVLLIVITAPLTAQQVFFGEDLGAGENTPLSSWPNSDAARAQFMAMLAGVGTEDFESFSPGAAAPLTVDFGDAGTATLQGSGAVIQVTPGTTNGYGRYAVSGSKLWETSTNFTIVFSQPQAAVGFYGIDVGDFAGQLTLTYSNGTTQNVVIPHTAAAPGGTVIFFGLIDTVHPFVSVTFENSGAAESFGFDDMTFATSTQVVPAAALPADVPTASGFGLAIMALLIASAAAIVIRRV